MVECRSSRVARRRSPVMAGIDAAGRAVAVLIWLKIAGVVAVVLVAVFFGLLGAD